MDPMNSSIILSLTRSDLSRELSILANQQGARNRKFDPEFSSSLRIIRPDWFPHLVIPGERYGKLVVLREHSELEMGVMRHNMKTAICLCDCGEHYVVAMTLLRSGRKTHCGCASYDGLLWPGLIIGQRRILKLKKIGRFHRALMRCPCGNKKWIMTRIILKGVIGTVCRRCKK